MQNAPILNIVNRFKTEIKKNIEAQKELDDKTTFLLKTIKISLEFAFPIDQLINKPHLTYKLKWGFQQPRRGEFTNSNPNLKHHDIFTFEEVLEFLKESTRGWKEQIDMHGFNKDDTFLVLAQFEHGDHAEHLELADEAVFICIETTPAL